MRGDQLARQWRIIRTIEASPNGLNVAEIAKREETGIRTIYRDLEALQSGGFPLYNEKVEKSYRWAFIDTCKFKLPLRMSRKAEKFANRPLFVFKRLVFQLWIFQGPKKSLRPLRDPESIQARSKKTKSFPEEVFFIFEYPRWT